MTVDRVVLFGKNSDRQRNEAQAIEYQVAADHSPGANVQCTYIAIPQAGHTASVLLCRPFWIWGAEMGANEHGVVIGNEGLHAKAPASTQNALTGMDLVRLALERSESAAGAVEVITELLEQFGQGGNCGHLLPAHYNNGFLVADAREAYVLETVGREWMLERAGDLRAISNRYSIRRAAARVSRGLRQLIRDSGWSNDPESDYAAAIADARFEFLGNAAGRAACSASLLQRHAGKLGVLDIMRILRDHGTGDDHHVEWMHDCTTRRSLCMHASGSDRNGQTVGSMVSEIGPARSVHWVTGTSAPCISIFKPVVTGVPLPDLGAAPTGQFDPRALWWRHEQLHRTALLGDFATFLAAIQPDRDRLEAKFVGRVATAASSGNRAELTDAVAACWREAAALEEQWRLSQSQWTGSSGLTTAWRELSQLAGLELPA